MPFIAQALSEKHLEHDRTLAQLKKVTREAEHMQAELKSKQEEHWAEIANCDKHVKSMEARILAVGAERDHLTTKHLHVIQE